MAHISDHPGYGAATAAYRIGLQGWYVGGSHRPARSPTVLADWGGLDPASAPRYDAAADTAAGFYVDAAAANWAAANRATAAGDDATAAYYRGIGDTAAAIATAVRS